MAGKQGAASKLTRARKRLFLNAYKAERGCRDCGERDPIVLQFHHLDPALKTDKLKKVKSYQTRYGWSGLSWADLEAELPKCVVLCANCHLREEHRIRQGGD